MFSWARRHLPEALLIPAGVGALAVTGLSDIDETVPWGHELGIGVSQLAFAYVGAYIFNWLIVERPKAKLLRGYYAAAQGTLEELALLPAIAVNELFQLADRNFDGSTRQPPNESKSTRWRMSAPASAIDDALGRLAMQPPSRVADLNQVFGSLSSNFDQLYESIKPLLTQFEPPVSVAVAALHSERALSEFKGLARTDNLSHLGIPMLTRLLSDALVDFQRAGRKLAEALEDSRHTPAATPGMHAWLQYTGLISPQAAKTSR